MNDDFNTDFNIAFFAVLLCAAIHFIMLHFFIGIIFLGIAWFIRYSHKHLQNKQKSNETPKDYFS